MPAINGALVFEIHSHFSMGPKHAPKDTDLNFNQFICIRACACSSNLNYAHECIENSINIKCPNEPQKIPKIDTTLLLFYVDTRKNFKAIRGNGYRLSPKVGCSLPKPSCLLLEALVCEKHIPKPAPNGTTILPRHADDAP